VIDSADRVDPCLHLLVRLPCLRGHSAHLDRDTVQWRNSSTSSSSSVLILGRGTLGDGHDLIDGRDEVFVIRVSEVIENLRFAWTDAGYGANGRQQGLGGYL